MAQKLRNQQVVFTDGLVGRTGSHDEADGGTVKNAGD